MIKTFHDQEMIVIDMPLLFEVGYEKKCDITCLVYVDLKTQVERLAKRDDITEEKSSY